MGQGTSDSILGVIWTTVWIIWIQAARCVCEQDNSKTYGHIFFQDMSEKVEGRND